jgi:hypothetical protein
MPVENQRQQKLFKIGTSGVTFYSDGSMTGSMTTATTGATSQVAKLRNKQSARQDDLQPL